jgi:hypothetical protein
MRQTDGQGGMTKRIVAFRNLNYCKCDNMERKKSKHMKLGPGCMIISYLFWGYMKQFQLTC